MAIIKCEECGKEISDKAYSCPNCGCPIKPIQEKIKSKEIKKTKSNVLAGILMLIGIPLGSLGVFICVFGIIWALVELADEKIEDKKWAIISCCVFFIMILVILASMVSTTNNSETINTYTIGKMNYSVPKELALIETDDKHKFIINDSAVLLIGGFLNETNYTLNEKERELWYQNSINTLIGNNSTTHNIENISINDTIWKKINYSMNTDSEEPIEVIAFILLDKNSEYYYSITLSQNDNINEEFIKILENVINSITFISSDNSNNPTSNFSTVTKENYDKIKEGMSKTEVLSILGDPESISESETPGLGTMELYHFQEGLSLKAIDVYFVNGSVYMKNWTEL